MPEEVEMPEVFETFAELKRQGKARFLGASSHNDPAGVLRAAVEGGQYDVARSPLSHALYLNDILPRTQARFLSHEGHFSLPIKHMGTILKQLALDDTSVKH